MNTTAISVETKKTGNILETEVVSIIKGAQDWLQVTPVEEYRMESLRKELVRTLRDLRKDREEADFFIAAASVQLGLCLEQKKYLDATIEGILTRKEAEKSDSLKKGLEAAYWRTMRTRKKLMSEIDVLFREKREWTGKLQQIESMKNGIGRIIDNPVNLRRAAEMVH